MHKKALVLAVAIAAAAASRSLPSLPSLPRKINISCRPGQGQAYRAYENSWEESLAACASRCHDDRPACVAFDFASVLPKLTADSCRLYKDNIPRLGDIGYDRRKYCTIKLPEVPDLEKEAVTTTGPVFQAGALPGLQGFDMFLDALRTFSKSGRSAAQVLQALEQGVSQHVVSSSYNDGTVTVLHRSDLQGDVATNTKTPLSVLLNRSVSYGFEQTDFGIRLHLTGVQLKPYKQMPELYKASRVKDTCVGSSSLLERAQCEQRQFKVWFDAHKTTLYKEARRNIDDVEGTKFIRMYDTIPVSVVPSKDVAKILYGWASAAHNNLENLHVDEDGQTSFGLVALPGQEDIAAVGGAQLDPESFRNDRAAFKVLARMGFADAASMAFSAALAAGQSDRIEGASLPAMLTLLRGDTCGACKSWTCSIFQQHDQTYACEKGRLLWAPI